MGGFCHKEVPLPAKIGVSRLGSLRWLGWVVVKGFLGLGWAVQVDKVGCCWGFVGGGWLWRW